MICAVQERGLCHCWPSLSQISLQYSLSLSLGVSAAAAVSGAVAPLGLATPAVWELLWVYRLKASQFRSAWTSQAALRRKSKLTASPPLTKTHSSWRAMVCSRSLCHHPFILCALYTHLDTLTAALEASAPTGAPAFPPEEWHTRHTADLLREGGLLAAECLQALWRWPELLLPCTQWLLISWASSYRPDQAASNKGKN